MKTYYLTKDNIIFFASEDKGEAEKMQSYYPDFALKSTERTIIYYKYSYFFLDEKYDWYLEDLRREKIIQLDSNCKSYIYSKYPIETQSNIIARIGYTDEDFETYKQFNLSQRQKYHEKEQQINEAKTIEEVEAVDIEFNDENTEDKA